jgi:hypothetical protein
VDILLHQVVEELAGVLEGRSQLHCPAGPPPAGAARVAHPLQHGADVFNRAAHDNFPHHLPMAAAAVRGYTDLRILGQRRFREAHLSAKESWFLHFTILIQCLQLSTHKTRHSACNAPRRKIGRITEKEIRAMFSYLTNGRLFSGRDSFP